MKLLRHGPANGERPGLVDLDGVVRDLSGIIPDISGAILSPDSLADLRRTNLDGLPIIPAETRLGPCVGSVGKFVCIGLNSRGHATESRMVLPTEPVIFMKATSSISGAGDDIVLPPGSEKTDWEVELGVVIGSHAKFVEEQDALDHVAGFCVINDVSERAFQLDGTGQWVKGKSADTFGPVGPWLVTRDELDWQDLELWLDVNGERRQSGATRSMVFGVPFLVSYVSRFMSLQPGDVIATGTPPGVALGAADPVYLRAGDEVRLGITGLGEQRQRVRTYPLR